jgi:hypothetical protein
MLRTTSEQAVQHQMHQNVNLNGGHTVGAPDGGAGIPGIGWSTEHGDLRIPHFFGLHGVQVIPFLAWFLLLHRRRATALVFTASTSYLGFVLVLTSQALRGESIVQPGPATLSLLGVWLIATVAAFTAVEGIADESRSDILAL